MNCQKDFLVEAVTRQFGRKPTRIDPVNSSVGGLFYSLSPLSGVLWWDFEAKDFIDNDPGLSIENPLFIGDMRIKIQTGAFFPTGNCRIRFSVQLMSYMDGLEYRANGGSYQLLNLGLGTNIGDPFPALGISQNLNKYNSNMDIYSPRLRYDYECGTINFAYNLAFRGFKVYFR